MSRLEKFSGSESFSFRIAIEPVDHPPDRVDLILALGEAVALVRIVVGVIKFSAAFCVTCIPRNCRASNRKPGGFLPTVELWPSALLRRHKPLCNFIVARCAISQFSYGVLPQFEHGVVSQSEKESRVSSSMKGASSHGVNSRSHEMQLSGLIATIAEIVRVNQHELKLASEGDPLAFL